MLKKLRKKLTILSASLTGSVVLAVCLTSFLLIRSQYLHSRELAFQLAASEIQTRWQIDGGLSAQWLRSSVEVNGIGLAFWEDTIPMDFGVSDMAQGEALKVKIPAEQEQTPYYFSDAQTRCAWFSFSFEYGSREYLVWQDTTPEWAYLLRLGLIFAGIAAVSLGIVGMLCFYVAGRAILPAQEAMERQEHFVAAASHELRSPLTVLKTGFGVIQKDPGETERYLALMSREADRMGVLVDDLLILAGGGTLRKNYAPGLLELDTLLIDFADAMTPVAEKKGIFLEVCLPEEMLPAVRADENMLRQILTILVDNGLRYAPEGSGIQLSLDQRGKQCILSVADHGPGVPDAEKTRIFDRFYRSSQSRTDPSHFGLGLSVARELTTILNGSIGVEDTPGGGATFRIRLQTEEPFF